MRSYSFILCVLLANLPAFSQSATSKRAQLLDSLTKAATGDYYTGIDGIVIAKDGRLLYEQYFNGWKKDSVHDARSAFKSITSILAGIAVDQGLIHVNQKVYDFFPEYKDFSGKNAWKKNMTIEHLLLMKTGFDCEEFNGDKDCETDMMESKDWVQFSLAMPMKQKPGTEWAYLSGAPMIMSGIISRAANRSIMDFAKQYLFDPLGITKYRWTVDPGGHGMTAGSFYILPYDMMKIGQLVQHQGLWNGKRIVSADWLTKSTNAAVPIKDFSFVEFSRSTVAIPQPAYYGYYWYKEVVKTKDFQETMIFASGNGGQYIIVIERLGLVVAFMQGNYQSWKAKKAFDLLARYIIPAFEQ